MIIIAGSLRLAAADRDRYLRGVAEVTRAARRTPGCLDFVQAADPLDPELVHVYERWESDDAVERFRTQEGPEPELPGLRAAEVRRYRVATVEPP